MIPVSAKQFLARMRIESLYLTFFRSSIIAAMEVLVLLFCIQQILTKSKEWPAMVSVLSRHHNSAHFTPLFFLAFSLNILSVNTFKSLPCFVFQLGELHKLGLLAGSHAVTTGMANFNQFYANIFFRLSQFLCQDILHWNATVTFSFLESFPMTPVSFIIFNLKKLSFLIWFNFYTSYDSQLFC